MAVTFVQRGDVVDYTPDADVAAGVVVVQEDLVGVTKLGIKANTLGALAVSGVLDFPKDIGSATAISAGAKVYWDAVNEVATTDADSGANKFIGKATRAASDDDETVRARMSQ